MFQFIIISVTGLIISYLSGSVNYAILVTRLVSKKDIRTMGNKNPGTSNVMRSVGKPWGFLVGFLDAFKAMAPLILFHLLYFKETNNLNFALLYLLGMAAVLGHCKPVFFGFKGGGGIGTMQGVSLFFIPVEYLISMFISGIIVLIFFKKTKHKLSQWTPMLFVTLTPFLTMGLNPFINIPLFAHISIGGHPLSVVAGALALSLMILFINMNFMKQRKSELDAIQRNEEWDGNIAPR
jgi:acyl-phosphate glycerol 3-phosphate acyltransferase